MTLPKFVTNAKLNLHENCSFESTVPKPIIFFQNIPFCKVKNEQPSNYTFLRPTYIYDFVFLMPWALFNSFQSAVKVRLSHDKKWKILFYRRIDKGLRLLIKTYFAQKITIIMKTQSTLLFHEYMTKQIMLLT